jgi:hypothetical protein
MEQLLTAKRSSLLASLAMENMTLKVILVVLGSLMLVETTGLITMAFKKPLVVAIDSNQPRVLSTILDDDSVSVPELRAFISDLLSQKFSKKPTIEGQKQSCRYFAEGLREACEKDANNKKILIPQDFIVDEISWDEKSEKASLKIKRFATFNGTISSVNAKLNIKIIKRRRTAENPWGLFIGEWKEEVQK